jgi:hypothetical protein
MRPKIQPKPPAVTVPRTSRELRPQIREVVLRDPLLREAWELIDGRKTDEPRRIQLRDYYAKRWGITDAERLDTVVSQHLELERARRG